MREIRIIIADDADDDDIGNLLEALAQNDCPMHVLTNDEIDQ